MMNQPCPMIQDLLPLYVDGAAGEETRCPRQSRTGSSRRPGCWPG